ncbi:MULTISPECIES: MlaD family protein [Sphingomonas]|uniref:MlaD family protein n=1 Tax=Sphingomonas TaxID=13687 RepID=UPI00082E80EE|nr:MlaD family protein [Sphingomonas sp. CCH10-B3]MBA3879063.1 MCE family protein [Sphingobium sp.]
METRSNHVFVGAVVLVLLAMVALFLIWLARLNGSQAKEYDIFFKQSVNGLNKGSEVGYSGVPSGQVTQIALFKDDPQFVRVRIRVEPDTPVLEGTTAYVQGSFTGTSTVQLDGAVKGAPPIVCPAVNPQQSCPYGVPVIPTRQGGLGALLSSAPELLQRLSTLTAKVTELLNDRNSKSLANILANTDRLTRALADQSPDIGKTLAETRTTLQKVGAAADQIGALADKTGGAVDDLKPAAAKLSKALDAAQHSLETIDTLVADAKPGVQAFSKQTVPEIGQLVRDLRVMSAALTNVAEKIDQGGAGALLGQPALPDYKPKK